MQNTYVFATNPPVLRISMLLTTNRLSFRIWLRSTCY